MKKLFFLYLIMHFWFIPVMAQEYDVHEFIPIDNEASVHTEKFDYHNFVFSTQVDDKGNHLLKFDSIHNNTRSRSAVSINLLIFDENKKNIGFLSYCSDKDMKSDNSGFKIDGGTAKAFQIIIDSNYFVTGKTIMDSSYVVVLDDNKYCRIEDSNQYANLTLDEIIGEDESSTFIKVFQDFFSNVELLVIILVVIVSFIIIVLLGFLLNSLYRKMYGVKTILSFIPLVNMFIAMKLAFGNIVASVYIAFFIISLVIYFFKIKILLYIFLGLFIVSIIVVIIKIITGKYDLFYLEPAMEQDDNILSSNDSYKEEAVYLDYNDLTSTDTQITLEDSMKRNDTNNYLSDLDDDDDDDFSDFF